MPEDEFGRALDLVYEAALDPGRWSDALNAIAALLGGEGGSFAADHGHAQLSLSTGVGTEILSGYNPHWHAINPLWPGVLAAPTGSVIIDRRFVDWNTYRRSEFYNDYVLAQGGDGVIGIKAMATPDLTALVAIHRARAARDRPFGDAEARHAARLAPHLARAVMIAHRLAALGQAAALGSNALEHLSHAAFILDPGARVLALNGRAESLLREADGLFHGPDGLRAARPATTAALRRLVAAAAAPGGVSREGELAAPAILPLERAPGRRPLGALVGPVRAGSGWSLLRTGPDASLLLVNDPEAVEGPTPAQLRGLYGLTPAEAALALAVAQGEGMQAAADRLGISIATARTHLQRVFGKTGTARQAELVRLLLTGFPAQAPRRG